MPVRRAACIRLFAGAALLALAGCGTGGGLLKTEPWRLPALATPPEVEGLLTVAVDAREQYGAHAGALKQQTTAFIDLPLLGAAVGSAGALLFGAHTDALAGIGLGAGALTAGRGYLKPADRAAAYDRAIVQIDCVIAAADSALAADPEGQMLADKDDTAARLRKLMQAVGTHQARGPGFIRQSLEAIEAQSLAPQQAQMRLMSLDLAADKLQAAGRAAAAALAAYDLETRAMRLSGPEMAKAMRTIDRNLAAAVGLQPADFDGTLDQMRKAAADNAARRKARDSAEAGVAGAGAGTGTGDTENDTAFLNKATSVGPDEAALEQIALATQIQQLTRSLLQAVPETGGATDINEEMAACPTRT